MAKTNRKFNQKKKILKQNDKILSKFKRQMTKKTKDKLGKYICSLYYKGIISLIHKHLLQINKRKTPRKMAKVMNRYFTEKKMQKSF